MSGLDEDRAAASASMSDEGGVEGLAIVSLQDTEALIDMPVEDSDTGRPLSASQSPRKRQAHAARNHLDPERMTDDNEPSPAWDVCIDCLGPVGEKESDDEDWDMCVLLLGDWLVCCCCLVIGCCAAW